MKVRGLPARRGLDSLLQWCCVAVLELYVDLDDYIIGDEGARRLAKVLVFDCGQ